MADSNIPASDASYLSADVDSFLARHTIDVKSDAQSDSSSHANTLSSILLAKEKNSFNNSMGNGLLFPSATLGDLPLDYGMRFPMEYSMQAFPAFWPTAGMPMPFSRSTENKYPVPGADVSAGKLSMADDGVPSLADVYSRTF